MHHASPSRPAPKKVILLGSTGSIGVNTLDVLRHLNANVPNFRGRGQVVGLAAGSNADLVAQQASAFDVHHVAIADPKAAEQFRKMRPHIRLFPGAGGCEQLVESLDADVLVGAVVGAAGLPATLIAIRKGMDIALANKETLVAAGELVIPLVAKHRVNLLPIDSEHSAIFQCLQGRRDEGTKGRSEKAPDELASTPSPTSSLRPSVPSSLGIKRIVLTASGGPFRRASKDQIANATVAEALKHPTWNMGRKITIDSATMMNKALEIIEAHWLFGLRADQIDVIIHPQSIAHSFVEFEDNSVLAQLGSPDMRTPIQYALTWPDRAPGISTPMDWSKLRQLDFEAPDHDRFPALKLAYHVINAGGTSGAILNAANEEAVAAFLSEQIRFGRITELVAEALNAIDPQPVEDLQTILTADAAARQYVRQHL
ncbi:MAG: 1-deoxy-D-xylulose-5-phosphate reductoisomerase [Phycisphaeraceae bacterium]